MLGKFIINDILIYSDSDKVTHIQHIKKVLSQLLRYQVYIKGEECEFNVNVALLG